MYKSKTTGAKAPAMHLFRCVQHIFDENPVTSGRIVHQNMGHGAHQLPVLYDRTAAHE